MSRTRGSGGVSASSPGIVILKNYARRRRAPMPSRESEVLILRTYPYREADLIVSFITRDEGKLRGIARGARRPKESLGLWPGTAFARAVVLLPARKPGPRQARPLRTERPADLSQGGLRDQCSARFLWRRFRINSCPNTSRTTPFSGCCCWCATSCGPAPRASWTRNRRPLPWPLVATRARWPRRRAGSRRAASGGPDLRGGSSGNRRRRAHRVRSDDRNASPLPPRSRRTPERRSRGGGG